MNRQDAKNAKMKAKQNLISDLSGRDSLVSWRLAWLGVLLEFNKSRLGVLGVLAVKHWYEDIF
jgi:hypothetical protein